MSILHLFDDYWSDAHSTLIDCKGAAHAFVLFDGDVESAIRQVRQRHVMTVAVGGGLNHMARDLLQQHSDVAEVEMNDEEDNLRVTLEDGVEDGSFIAELMVKNNFRLKLLQEEEIDLEDVFMGITKGITN